MINYFPSTFYSMLGHHPRECIASFIAQHLKKDSCPTTEFQEILTENITTLEQENNKQKLQIRKALHIRNIQPKLNRILNLILNILNFPVLMYLNVFSN